MEIIIGPAQPVRPVARGKRENNNANIEAKILNVRPPRHRVGPPPVGQDERRNYAENLDPPAGRVLVLMVPEGYMLPQDLSEGNYRVFLRFARR